jgi:hypothetical protein
MQPRLQPGAKPVLNPPAIAENGPPRTLVSGQGVPLLARFLGKFVLDIMPAALASVIGGFLFTQYQFGHKAPQPALERVTPASAEMMALVRDEHAMIIDYLKSQMAAEKSRIAKQDADLARAAEDAKLAEAAEDKAAPSKPAMDIKRAAEIVPRRNALAASKPVIYRTKPVMAQAPAAVAAQHSPMVIAQADQGADSAAAPDRPDPDSLLGKTIELKDHVVAATRQAVSAIGDVFSAIGDKLTPSATLPRQLASEY